MSLESYGQILDFRANGYFPVADRQKDDYSRISNVRYQGNQLVFDYLRQYSQAQSGFDLEVGVVVPSKFAANHNMRVIGGYYHFLGNTVPAISGYKARLEGSLNDNISMLAQMTDDNTFGRNFNIGVAYTFGPRTEKSRRSDTKFQQMTRYIHRNYNIIVTRQQDNSYHQTAINPATGLPYTFEHVSSTDPPAAAGTSSNPYLTIAQAQAANPDIILVQSGSVLTAPVVLAPTKGFSAKAWTISSTSEAMATLCCLPTRAEQCCRYCKASPAMPSPWLRGQSFPAS